MSLQSNYEALMRELDAYRKVDPALFLQGVAVGRKIADPELRFVRAEAIQTLAAKLQAVVRLCDFQNEIVVRPDGVFVDAGGILLEALRTGIYFKATGAPIRAGGDELAGALDRMNIDIATAVDVGANFGEISLWLARRYPRARIVAIEPSSDNLGIFQVNKSAQNFPTQNIEVIHGALSDKDGTATVARGAGTMNQVSEGPASDSHEAVTCERLDTLFNRLGLGTADFVKIDIEGGEPKLREAIMILHDRVRSYYIEFSQFAPFEDYMALAATLLAHHFACHDQAMSVRLDTPEAIASHLRAAFAAGSIAVTNLWFVAER